jgi:capsular exopolysaccharide synthesis family protein
MDTSFSLIPAIFGRWRWPALATFVAVMAGAIGYLVFAPSTYEATVKILVDNKQLSVSELGREATDRPESLKSSPIATQAELTKSQRILSKSLAQASQEGIKDLPTVGQLIRDTKVTILPDTGILGITYRNQDPQLAARLANIISEILIQNNVDTTRSAVTSLRMFLENEVPKKHSQLLKLEAAESEYKRTSGIVSLDNQTQSLVGSLSDLESQERALSAQIREAKARDTSLRGLMNTKDLRKTFDAVRVGQDESLKTLRTKLAELEALVVTNRSRLGDGHPDLLAAVEQRDQVKAQYIKQLARITKGTSKDVDNGDSSALSQDLSSKLILTDVERSGLERKLAEVRTGRAQLQTTLEQLPSKEQALAELSRSREEAAATLTLLQRKLSESRITEAQLISGISIIDKADLPKGPAWPNRPLVLVLAVATGLIFVIGVVLLLEALDGTLRGEADVEKLLRMPVLGVLPILPSSSLKPGAPELFLDDLGTFESYRMLLKTLEFRSQDIRVVVVSSTIAQEGKSLVASRLASVAASLSRRTLIIDADLRRPVQHKLFGLRAKPGLSHVITDLLPLIQAVQPTAIPNLSVLTYGEIYKHPSQLIESAQMQALLEQAAEQYDLVIIDTPPITSCVDAALLSRSSDGMLFVTRPTMTSRNVALRAISELNKNRVSILGVVVNGTNNQTEPYYRYPIQGYQSQPKSLNP